MPRACSPPAIRTGSGERQNVVNLDWIIIHLRNKSVVLCVLCAALPARPGFPGSPADLYGGGTWKKYMHVYTYVLR